ncbi:eukaryotic translation elongation factor 1 delta a (guanine nucleotide exchange protein) isoform X2 [Engraulis encrasicolus]|uniref:eukaryotic translation elongation factor 1 delta a (guanine nucleotide exchange protein) isoform X2 n=1 Tax=Engraulis encrasicolus TaxID=184585 RepID=UPI002FD351E8
MSAQRDVPQPGFWRGGGGGTNGPRGGGGGRGYRQGNGPMLFDMNLNGDDLNPGQQQQQQQYHRRRRTHSDSLGDEPERGLLRAEATPFSPSSPSGGRGMWVNRSLHDQGDQGFHQTSWGSVSPPSASPRERAPRALVFRSRRNQNYSSGATVGFHTNQDEEYEPQQQQGGRRGGGGNYGGRGRQFTRTQHRSSSEPKRGKEAEGGAMEGGGSSSSGGGGGGVVRSGRRRGNSETERTPYRTRAKPVAMSGLQCMMHDGIWFDKPRYDDAECRFYEGMNGIHRAPAHPPQEREASAILQDIAKARQNIQKSLAGTSTSSTGGGDQTELVSRMKSLEVENQSLHKAVDDLKAMMSKMEARLSTLEKSKPAAAAHTPAPAAQTVVVAPTKKVEVHDDEDDDDDIDLFGSDDDEEADRIKAERVAAYNAKKSKKPVLIAKSSILLDVKPWDDETDMAKMEELVRSIQTDGLLWGASKLVPVGYGIKKLQISCVVEDDKVGTDYLEEEITQFEDYVQSVDVAAFNKI